MKSIILISFVFFVNKCLSQSPLLQSNSRSVSNNVNSLLVDSLSFRKLNFQQLKLDTIHISLDTSTKIFERMAIKQEQAERAKTNIKILREERIKASSTKRKEIDTKIKNLENNLNNSSNRDLDTLRYENVRLKNTGISLQLALSDKNLKTLTDSLEKHSHRIKTMSDEWSKQQWREDGKTLTRSDDSLLFLTYSKITLSLDEATRNFENLLPEVKKAKDSLEALKKKEEKVSSILSLGYISGLLKTLDQMVSELDQSLNNYNTSINSLNKNISSTGSLIDVKQNIYSEQELAIKNIYSKYKTDDKQDGGDLKALASFTQPIADEGKLVPQISILGFRQKSSKEQSLSYNLKLFVSTSETKSVLNSEYRFFIPEASTYGFMADFSFGFLPVANTKGKQTIKTLGLNGGAYYLGKSIVRVKDSTTYNIGLLQFKAGIQYVLIPQALNIYANLNPYFVANGNESFSASYPSYAKKLNMFTDFGLECYLELTKKQNDFFLDFDLGFISKGGDVGSVLKTQDALIPRIKIGLVKSFDF